MAAFRNSPQVPEVFFATARSYSIPLKVPEETNAKIAECYPMCIQIRFVFSFQHDLITFL